MNEATWRGLAACRAIPAEMFFPTRGEPVAPALAICALCPVRVACLNHALEAGEKHGIWGGTSERERRRLRRARRVTLTPAA